MGARKILIDGATEARKDWFVEKDLSDRDYRTLDRKVQEEPCKRGGGLCALRSRRGWPAKQKWDMFWVGEIHSSWEITVKLNFLPINQSGAMVLGEDKGFEKATRNQPAITPRKLGGAHSQMIPPFLLAHPLFPLTASDLGLHACQASAQPLHNIPSPRLDSSSWNHLQCTQTQLSH